MFYTYFDFLKDILHHINSDGSEKPMSFDRLSNTKFTKYAKRLCIDYYTFMDISYTTTHKFTYVVDKKMLFIETIDEENKVVFASTQLYQVVGRINHAKGGEVVKYIQAAIPALAFFLTVLTMTCHLK